MFNLFKTTLFDLLLLYKNFFHWNTSKLVIKFYSLLLALASVLPFLLIYFIYSISTWNSFFYYIWALLWWNLVNDVFWFYLHIIIAFFYYLVFFYSYLLLFNLNLWYLNWEKSSYFNKKFLDKKILIRYLLLTFSIFWFLIIPFLFFVFLAWILIFVLGWIQDVLIMVDSWPINVFSILLLLFFLISLFSAIYIFYRLFFSYFCLLEDKNNEKNIKTLLLESFNNTKWFSKSIKTWILFLFFWFFYLAFSYPGAINDLKYSELTNYKQYINLPLEVKENYKSRNTYYYSWLELSYWNFNEKEIDKLLNSYFYKSLIFKIFEFLFVYWFISMLLTSIYIRLIKNKEIIKETKVEKIKKIAKKLSFKNKEL